MYENGFRGRVVRSGMTLPLVLVTSGMVWLLFGGFLFSFYAVGFGFLMTLATAYVIMEWANSNALLRIRSRLITSIFWILIAACPFLHACSLEMLPALCVMLSYVALFHSYQRGDAYAESFHAFLFIGIAGIFFPSLFLLVPAMYLSMFFQLRSLTLRMFFAGLLGLLLPHWLWLAYAVWVGEVHEMGQHLLAGLRFDMFDYSLLTPPQILSATFVLFYAFLATVHFVRTAFNDKIRTRMYFYMLILQEFSLICLLLLLPKDFNAIFRLLVVCVSPLIAHYFALARGRAMNIWFVVTLLALLSLGVYNYMYIWMHS